VVCEYGQVHQENGSPISGLINIKNLSPEKPDFGRAVLFWDHIKAFQRSACLSAYSTAHYWCCASSGSLKTCIKLVRALLFFLVCHLVFTAYLFDLYREIKVGLVTAIFDAS